jgi:hypothetical protein
MMSSRTGRPRGVWLGIVLLGLASPALAGQSGAVQQSSTSQSPAPPAARPDFLFGRPHGWVGVRGGWLAPRAGGDLFAFVSDQLTIEKGDFAAPAFMSEGGVAVSSRVGVSGGLEFTTKTIGSEYRRFVGSDDLPINQSTSLMQTAISGSARVALWEPGRSISRLAFVPRAVVPYVGAGAGMLYYELTQSGEFVDFQTLRVFRDTFRSQGWAPSAHVFGGADVRLYRVLYLDVEGRYVWAHAELGSDFVGFDGIDLDGFRLWTGVSILF